MRSRPPSFRRRLLIRLGAALGVALLLLGLLVGAAAHSVANHLAHAALDAELHAVAHAVVTPAGRLDVDAYDWSEPHHRFAEARIDPYFLHVFDANGHLLRRSENVRAFPTDAFPDRLLVAPGRERSWLRPLQTFHAGDRLLYADAHPLRTRAGTLLGYVQVARDEPGVAALVPRLALGLGGGFLIVWGGLLALVWGAAGRVVRPLETITAATRAITPDALDRRVPVPAAADRETRQLAVTLNELLARVEQAFEEMQRFTAHAAHELQTPLTVLRGHLDVALRRERDPAAYRRTLRVLLGEVEGLSATLRSLLMLSRLDRDARVLPREPVDLAGLVEQEAAALRAQAATKGLEICVAAEATYAPGQPELLREVVRNLLDNAVKYTDAGRIEVHVTQSDGHARLRVADTGVGIPEAHVPLVTRRFYREPTVQHIPGSGLGLAFVDEVVQRHGGTLAITASLGKGTTVEVTLPALTAVAATP